MAKIMRGIEERRRGLSSRSTVDRAALFVMLLALFLAAGESAYAATYYVDGTPTGCGGSPCSDSNNGTTEATAFASPHGCDLAMVAGDTCLIKNSNPGYYRNSGSPAYIDAGFAPLRTGTPTAPITYKAYAGHSPKICSSPGCTTDYANYTNPAIGTNNPAANNGPSPNKSYIVFDGLAIVGSMAIGGGNSHPSDHITVQNCDLTGGYTYSNSACTGTGGGADGNWAALRVDYVSNSTFKNNYIHDIICPAPDRGGGSTWFHADNNVFEYNTVYNTSYNAIILKADPTNNVVRYNRFIRVATTQGEPALQGPNQENGGGNSIHHNVLVCGTTGSDAPGMRIITSMNASANSFYNNTVYGCDRGFWQYAGAVAAFDIHNNIFGGLRAMNIALDDGSANSIPTNLNYNAYGRPDDATHGYRRNGSSSSTLAAWRSYWSGLGYPSFEQKSIAADCGFVNAGTALSSDFHLASGSPCAGVASDGGNLGAYQTSSDCIGYACGSQQAPSPGIVQNLHRVDVHAP